MNSKTYNELVRFLYDRCGHYHDILCLNLPQDEKIAQTAKLQEVQEILKVITQHKEDF